MKFNLDYVLAIETPTVLDSDGNATPLSGLDLLIAPPFTMEFNINRNILSSANTATIRLFNLSQKTQLLIYKDRYDYATLKGIVLRAGYKGDLSTIFAGNIVAAHTERQGTNMITTIEAEDGGWFFANGRTNKTFPKGTPVKAILNSFFQSLPGAVKNGVVGNYTDVTTRSTSLSGPLPQVLKQLAKDGFFVDNGKAFALQDDEGIIGNIQLITAATGLLDTPVREQQYLRVNILFEPKVMIGQIVVLASSTVNPIFNGTCKIVAIKHQGVISEAVGGQTTTEVGLFFGKILPVGKG